MMHDPLIVTRIIRLATPDNGDAELALATTPGVLGVTSIHDCRHLKVTYDLRRLHLEDVLKAMTGSGAALSSAPLARFRLWLAGFQEDNLLDQANLVHHCCNLPPRRG